jgi:hypothetical protein
LKIKSLESTCVPERPKDERRDKYQAKFLKEDLKSIWKASILNSSTPEIDDYVQDFDRNLDEALNKTHKINLQVFE